MRILILEDSKRRIKWFRKAFKGHELFIFSCVKNAELFLKDNTPDLVFLDHDLDNRMFVKSCEPNTGYQLAMKIIELGKLSSEIYIHSMNPFGSRKIYSILERGNVSKKLLRIPYPKLRIIFHTLNFCPMV